MGAGSWWFQPTYFFENMPTHLNPFARQIWSSNHTWKFKQSEWNHLGAFGYLRGIFWLAGYPTLDKNSPHHSTSSTVLPPWKVGKSPKNDWNLKVRKTMVFWGGHQILRSTIPPSKLYTPLKTNMTMEHHPFQNVFPIKIWWFSIVRLIFTKLYGWKMDSLQFQKWTLFRVDIR